MREDSPGDGGRVAPENDVHRRLAEIEAIYATAPVGLCVFDEQGRYVRINERLAEINGRPVSEHVGRTIREVVPDLADQAEAILRRVLETGEPVRDFELSGTTLAWEGARRTWLEHWLPLKDDAGQVIGVNVVAEDITQPKQRMEALERQVAERTSALRMLRDVAAMANRAGSVAEALEYCLRRVAEHNGWSFGHAFLPSAEEPDLLLPAYVWYTAHSEQFAEFRDLTLRTVLRAGECLPGRVFASGEPQWTTEIPHELGPRRVELARALGITTTAAFPVMAQDRVVGVLEFFSEKAIEPDGGVLESMASVGTQLGRVIERKAFQDRLLTLSEDEHRRIGQELHDDVGQELTGLALKTETLGELLGADAGPTGELAREIVAAVDRIRGKVRALSRGLIPTEIDAPALGAALEGLALQIDETEGMSCRFRCEGQQRVADSATATQLYRVAQEAVGNLVRHSGAEHVEIGLTSDETATVLEVRDDGHGIPPEPKDKRGMGLQIMRYRAGLIGAALSVESSPGEGTRVTCRLPGKT